MKELPAWASDRQLAEYFEVSRQTIWRWSNGWTSRNKHGELINHAPRIPRPEKIGPNTSRWRTEGVLKALEA